jgi:hypothetical protein
MLLDVAVMVVVTCGICGCGTDRQPGSTQGGAKSRHAAVVSLDPRRVAERFAMFYANLAANQDEPATPAQVRALAKTLDPVCSPPRDGQYACTVHLPSRGAPTVQRCVAVVEPSGSVTGRCSAGAGAAPIVEPGYVDCASVGHVVSVTDATGDERRVVPGLRTVRLVPAHDPQADLLEIRVAATSSRFCADFRTAAPLGPGSTLGLDIKPEGPVSLFEPVIDDRRGTPQLESPVGTDIAGQIGTAGDWTSMVIRAGNPAAPLPHEPFRFRSYANHELLVPGVTKLTTDSAPDAPQYATYP